MPNDDFFSGVRFSKYRLFRGSYAMCDAPLGFVQTERPGAYWNYDEMISPKEIRKDSASKGGTIQIYEVQCGTGRLFVCHADLLALKEEYPEARCLYNSLVNYITAE